MQYLSRIFFGINNSIGFVSHENKKANVSVPLKCKNGRMSIDNNASHRFLPISDGTGRPPNCCPANTNNNAASLICAPIPVPSNDPVLGKTKNCLNFVRSLGGVRVDCQIGALEQVKQV
jgi:hypothetical protein